MTQKILYPKFKIGEIVKVGDPTPITMPPDVDRMTYISKWKNFMGIVVGCDGAVDYYNSYPVRDVEFTRLGGARVSVCFRYEELLRTTDREKILYYTQGSEVLVEEESAEVCETN